MGAFCGGVIGGWRMALACWAAMVLPGVFMSLGALPFWNIIRSVGAVKQVLKGVNAAAAGLMASAFLMLWLKVVKDSAPRAAACVALVALQLVFKYKAPHVIGLGAAAGILVGFFQ